MANRDSTTNEPTSTIALPPLHQDFSWLPDSLEFDPNARFAAMVKTVTHGGMTIASLVRRNAMAPDSGLQPLLSPNDLDSLVGLMGMALEALNEAAENCIDRLDAAAIKGAKK